MTLRDHLHRWLHPRDPLLEAWKDDPFVEWMLKKTGRDSLFSRKGVSDALRALVVLLILCGVSHALIAWLGFSIHRVFPAVMALFISYAYGRSLIGSKVLKPKRELSLDDILADHSASGALASLWLSGLRGRDLAKVIYSTNGYGINYALVFVLLMTMMASVFFLMGPLLDRREIDVIHLLCIALLWSWCASVCYRVCVSWSNPFQALDDLPTYMASLQKPLRIQRGELTDPIPVSIVVVLVAVLLSLFVSLRPMALPFFPYGLVIYASGIALANYMVLMSPRQSARMTLKRLERRFRRVDRDFDRYMREIVFEDPDAGRTE